MSSNSKDRIFIAGLGVIALAALLYSFLIIGNILAWFGAIVPFVFLYLMWRLVLAVERIADAVEK
ncbi:hypothetical protein [Haladaptatus cibarius]|uniref:hypothetical protein n=1 Tax=Haladaptatus cibarius TaxID=453847 RepID=UPI00067913A3|nr:hypothetical protein [Haladaptatus cibarius]